MLVYRTEIAGLPVELIQQGTSQRFTVRYFKQVRRDLSYAQAAKELGECIMHAAACDGMIRDRETA